MKIFIDAGHNPTGADTGAAGNGLSEAAVTFSIAQQLKPLLEAAGHSVKLSRSSADARLGASVSESLSKRCALANSWGADLFVSVHCNAGGGRGTEVYAYGSSGAGAAYAQKIQSAIVKRLGTADRGVKYSQSFAVLRGTSMPAVLVETAFIDNPSDAALLRTRTADFAAAICAGITGQEQGAAATVAKESSAVEQTVMQLPEQVFVQELTPAQFSIRVCDCPKRSVQAESYFNAGFFTMEASGNTIPVGNLASGGQILSQAKDNPGWINVAGHKLTTVYTTTDGRCGLVQTDDLSRIPNLKEAVSGIPVIVGGAWVSPEQIRAEGYFGNETYDTWHGFLGIRGGNLVYVAMKCGFSAMCWSLAALGIHDAIKLDGGGSFILRNGRELAGTGENRRIHNVGVWQ